MTSYQCVNNEFLKESLHIMPREIHLFEIITLYSLKASLTLKRKIGRSTKGIVQYAHR